MYAHVLGKRLREEIEGKGCILPNQAGFRRGMGAIDNVYTLNYLVNRQLGRRDGN